MVERNDRKVRSVTAGGNRSESRWPSTRYDRKKNIDVHEFISQLLYRPTVHISERANGSPASCIPLKNQARILGNVFSEQANDYTGKSEFHLLCYVYRLS